VSATIVDIAMSVRAGAFPPDSHDRTSVPIWYSSPSDPSIVKPTEAVDVAIARENGDFLSKGSYPFRNQHVLLPRTPPDLSEAIRYFSPDYTFQPSDRSRRTGLIEISDETTLAAMYRLDSFGCSNIGALVFGNPTHRSEPGR
jgi:hypothetical protein